LKNLIHFFILFITSSQLQAAIYDFQIHMPQMLTAYLKDIQIGSKSEGSNQCQPLYNPLLKDGILDIRYAFGYFDDSENGLKKSYAGTNYGFSPSLDIVAFETLVKIATAPCRNRSMRLCDFQKNENSHSGKAVLEKTIRIQNQNTLVRLTITQASASEFFSKNTGPLRSSQKFLTEQSESNFFEGLKVADVVFYNGHSRNGGGPDFNPPDLTSSHKVNYKGFYEVQKPGLRRTLESLSQNPNSAFILGLFSCYSRLHFQKVLFSANPDQRLILSSESIDYFQTLKASVGYLEGILRGDCGQSLANTAKKDDLIRKGFLQYKLN
jgi:hypothetical protein